MQPPRHAASTACSLHGMRPPQHAAGSTLSAVPALFRHTKRIQFLLVSCKCLSILLEPSKASDE
ncbi:hypothetical protein STEG23_032484, partial [Scotinomys teguina]